MSLKISPICFCMLSTLSIIALNIFIMSFSILWPKVPMPRSYLSLHLLTPLSVFSLMLFLTSFVTHFLDKKSNSPVGKETELMCIPQNGNFLPTLISHYIIDKYIHVHYMHLRYAALCFDIWVHCEMIFPINLITLSITSHIYLSSVYVVRTLNIYYVSDFYVYKALLLITGTMLYIRSQNLWIHFLC